MATARIAPEVLAHLEWLGFVRPTGLVVSAPALARAGAILNNRDAEGQRRLRSCLVGDEEPAADRAGELSDVYSIGDEAEPIIADFREFATGVLGWSFSPKAYAGTDGCPIPSELEVAIPDAGVTLRPDFAVREREPLDESPAWQLLVHVLDPGQDLDRVTDMGDHLEASPHGRMERLLRQTGVPAGLVFNGRVIRLISAPHGESSGWLDFRVADMVLTAGRPIAAALRLLLGEARLLSLPRAQRLTALLDDSRKFQNEVSERLAEQVLHALYELLRGLQAADDASHGELLRRELAERPDEIYRALLTVILRLVFLLYAEERDMLSADETFLRFYSLSGLHERLREDAALYPDTMDQRFGAWAQLLVLFRMVHDGAQAGGLHLPRRRGVLFDPGRFPFLEGRNEDASQDDHETFASMSPPLVPDGTIYRALEKLLVLDGERISYRALDVEQIGSIYETMMGFRLEVASGRSVAIRAQKRHGAPTCIDLDALLGQAGKARTKWLVDRTDRKYNDAVRKSIVGAASVEDLHAALLKTVDGAATPDILPPGAMLLQPSEERRRSGSHYTPRSLTEPIVRTTLEPVLERLRGPEGGSPTPDQLLELKVCDPAMGSGAFLVEACRQLGDALVVAWREHGEMPEIPSDEDEVVFARRLVAQRCLYGVDRNPVAVDLAKVSLWLVTLARDHALTFLDHALRHGDSLLGLTKRQLLHFHWDLEASGQQAGLEAMAIQEQIDRVSKLREQIRTAGEDIADDRLRSLWNDVQSEASELRLYADLAVAAFFEGGDARTREARRGEYASAVAGGLAEGHRDRLAAWRDEDPPLAPFHWELEFPEVFDRENGGLDAIVGNPPFAGKNTLIAGSVKGYPEWLRATNPESHGNADLVAYFFRRSFDLLRSDGTFGLIATNTIGQGDTRATGLRWICSNGGDIFSATKRLKWPGLATVVVSVVHVQNGAVAGVRRLDGKAVDRITAFLYSQGGHSDPFRLAENDEKSFQGSIVLGMGFTFDDRASDGRASTLSDLDGLLAANPKNREVIFPYLGGDEVNSHPSHSPHRYIINFSSRSLEEASHWPDLLEVVRQRVKPERDVQKQKALREMWWQFARERPAMLAAIAPMDAVLVVSAVSQFMTLARVPTGSVFSHSLIVFPFSTNAALCNLQSRVHETWARFFGSSLEDRLRYTPTDCFETFPFPSEWHVGATFEAAGAAYHDFRADLMVKNDQGLTATYARFHDPEEMDSGIIELRRLHGEMDRVVLDAYGWQDIPHETEFLRDFDGEEDGESGPVRLRWPDEVKEEVLARLLELNRLRAAEEAERTAAPAAKRRGRPSRSAAGTERLFAEEDLP
jgi:hypothetical protein